MQRFHETCYYFVQNQMFLTLCFDMIQSIEIKLNTIFMSDILYTYDMYNYNFKHNAEIFL